MTRDSTSPGDDVGAPVSNRSCAPEFSVVVVHPSDELYGADRMLLHVLEAIRALGGVSVEVWLPDDVPHGAHPLCVELSRRGIHWRHANLPVLRRAYLRPGGLVRMWRAARSLRRDLRAGDVDLLYCGTSACLLASPIARSVGVPHRIVHVQERWSGFERHVLRLLARSTTSRIAISQGVADRCRLVRPAPVVIPNCVDDRSIRPVEHATSANPVDGVRYVVASRWNRWKGHETLLRAWNDADCPGTLTVLGGPPPVGEGVDVRELVRRIVGNPESVRIVGEVPDATPYIADADVLVLPSDEPEPFGLVIIEAFALSRPVVASRAGGPLEIVDDGTTGWLYDIGDHRELAAVLRSVGRADAAAAGERAREVYEERFTCDRYREQIRTTITAELRSRPGVARG